MTAPVPNPLVNAQNIESNTDTSAQPQGVADRIGLLNQNGHQWMEPSTQLAMATSATSDNDMLNIAGAIKTKLAQTWNGFTESTDDNVLHKQPTMGLALARMMDASLGPLPIAQPDMKTIQANLQKQGFGKGMSADGVWDAGWNDAYNQYTNHVVTKQLAGNQPGSVSTGSAGHSIWSDLLPSHAVDAIIGFAKSIPGDVRDLASDSVSSAVNLLHDPLSIGQELNPITAAYQESTTKDQSALAERAGAAVDSLGRKKMTAQEYENQHGLPRLAQNVGLLLNLVPIVGEGAKALDVARGEFAGALTKDAAGQSGGVVSKSLFGGGGAWAPGGATPAAETAAKGSVANLLTRVPEAAQRGPQDSVIARTLGGLSGPSLDLAGGDVAQQSGAHVFANASERAAAGIRGGLLNNSKVFTNIPLLRQVGPVVGRLADADGLYYKVRTLLAAPYQYGAVRVAGDIGQRTMLTGAAVRAGAQATQAVGLGNQETTDVQQGNALSTVDASLDRITGTPGAHPFTQAVNALGYILHGPLGDTANSVRAGDAVQSFTDTSSDALGKVGLYGIFQKGIAKATGTKIRSIDDLAKDFGGREYLDRFIVMKSADLAASHYSQRMAQEQDGLTFGMDGYREATGRYANDAWDDTQAHLGALRELMALEGRTGEGMSNRVAADITKEGMDPREYASDGVKWMQAGDVLTNRIIKSGLARYMFGADGRTVIANAQDGMDFGLGTENAVRLTSTTRRQYVNGVNSSFQKVQDGVNNARIRTGQAVVSAQSRADEASEKLDAIAQDHPDRPDLERQLKYHQGSVKFATNRQQLVEQSVRENRIDKLVRAMKQTAGPHGSDAEWDQLAKAHYALKKLTSQVPGEPFDLADALDKGGVDADAMYTKINGAPKYDTTQIGSGDWMRDNLPHKDGAIGLARIDTKSTQTATNDINRLLAVAQSATTSEAQEAALEAMRDYGFQEFGLTQRDLGAWDDPQGLADNVLTPRAKDLASDVFLTADAPTELKKQIADLAANGYKPMLGSHIGHIWDGSLPPMIDVDGAITRRRRFVEALGLGPGQVGDRAAGQDARIRILNEIQRAGDSNPKMHFPARTTAETTVQVLADHKLLPAELKGPERLAVAATRPFHKLGIKNLAETRGLDQSEAEKQYEDDIARVLQVRDIPRRKAMKALMTPGEGEGPNGPWRWDGMDKASAALVIRAALRGYAHRPASIMGAAGLEDRARAGFWVLDKLAVKFPESNPVQAVANFPNSFVQLRNRTRFQLSPFFDFRRIAKTNYKMSLDNVQPVLNPLKNLIDTGTFKDSHDYLNDLMGEPHAQGFDDADRYLHQQSVWGLYNSRHYEAYYAKEKRAQGATDSEIRDGIRRVFEYGSQRVAGRSPIERTANTIFFPFSFEKTLLRNTGAYLLDHPQQALLLTGAMEGYRQANQNDEISNWANDHLPILQDIQKLNAFAHGISPGQFGGINRPLFNLFLPQHWGSGLTSDNLKKNLPIWKDFGQLMSDATQQGKIGVNAGENLQLYTRRALHLAKPKTFLDPYKPTITADAQRQKAEVMRNQMITQLTPVLDYNAHQASDATKKSWSATDTSLPEGVMGQPIDRTTIGLLVQRWYPAYDPQFGAQYAEQQATAANKAIGALAKKDPAKAQEYTVLTKLANQVSGKIQRNEYDTATSAAIMAQFRDISVNAAESDPQFLAFYNQHFKWLMGPLTQVNP